MNIFFRLVYFTLPVTHWIFGNGEDLSDYNYIKCLLIFHTLESESEKFIDPFPTNTHYMI